VVAAILKSGLRIMPHSGGRVGRGIYFASENSKSAAYGKSSAVVFFLYFSRRKCMLILLRLTNCYKNFQHQFRFKWSVDMKCMSFAGTFKEDENLAMKLQSKFFVSVITTDYSLIKIATISRLQLCFFLNSAISKTLKQ
jgi:hypothetical protein